MFRSVIPRHPFLALSLAIVATAVAASDATAQAARDASPPSLLGPVAADGKLTVVYADADTPFLDHGPGGPSGFDYDVLQGFADRHGLTIELVSVADAGDLIPALRAGRAELIAGGFTHTPERARDVVFTGEVTPQRHVVITLSPDPAVDTVDALRRLKVGTVGGTSWEAATRAAGIPADKVDATFPLDSAGLLAALAEDRVDAVVTGLFFGLFLHRDDPRAQLGLLLGEPGFHGYATTPQHRGLRDALEAYLAGVRDSAGWYRIVIKHFGQDAPALFRRARAE
jgi:membrane-bound lytic murein transglycosylase F